MSTYIVSTDPLGTRLRKLRLERKLPLRKVAALLDMDVAILSKMERGERRLSKDVVLKLADIYQSPAKDLLIHYFKDRVLYEIEDEPVAIEALKAAEESITYRSQNAAFVYPQELTREKIITSLHQYFSTQSLISAAFLFGSFARGDDNQASDIDVAIVIHPDKRFTFFDLMDVQENLQKITSRKVDVVTINSLRPHMKTRFEKDKIKIYEA